MAIMLTHTHRWAKCNSKLQILLGYSESIYTKTKRMTPVCSFREFCCLAMSIEDLSLADNQSINRIHTHIGLCVYARAGVCACVCALYTVYAAHTCTHKHAL